MTASTRTSWRSKRPCRNTARLSARSSIRRWITLFTTTPARATTPRRQRPHGARRWRGSGNTWRREVHDVRQEEERNMAAASGGCGLIACSHLSCSPGATRNAVDFGRRDFLIDALAATAGFTGLGGCAAPLMSEAPSAQERAEVIVTNGRIATLNPRAPTAGALPIRGGNIVAGGSPAQIARPRGPRPPATAAGGPTRAPGPRPALT